MGEPRRPDRVAEAISALDTKGQAVRLAWQTPWLKRNKPFLGFVLKQP